MDDFSVSNIHQQPLLPLGELGTFDDSGVMPTCMVKVNDIFYLYYIGWNLGKTVPFRNSIGRAVSHDGINFQKEFPGPVLDRTENEPHFCASCCVLREDGQWKIWYLSCLRWETENNKPKHYYHIKYSESQDGVHWNREGKVAIGFKSKGEYAISVPRILKDDNGYKMWYSYRGGEGNENYKIGFAESADGVEWKRKDEDIQFYGGAATFDNTMQCYPCLINYKNKLYMLYNGNEYGKTGIGLAVLEDQPTQLS